VAFLRSSCFVAGIEGDAALRLLTPYPIDEVPVSEGLVVTSRAPEQILPAGSAVRVVSLEFASAAVEVRREPRNPRRHPWLRLKVENQPLDRTFVFVLPVTLTTEDDAAAAVEQVLSWEPLDTALGGYMEPVRRAIAEKRVSPGMDAAAVLMSWGWPEQREVTVREAGREEKWFYGSGRRRVLFGGGRVSRTEP
jgi:hypothetical protein